MRFSLPVLGTLCLFASATAACGDAPGDPIASPADDAGAALEASLANDGAIADAHANDAATSPHDAGHADAAHDAGSSPPPPPDIDTIPWETSGADVGYGAAFKDTGNPLGTSAFIGYAGYNVDATAARAWVTALYRAALAQRGVRYVWAVQGPSNPTYTQQEIGNSHVARALVSRTNAQTKFILVAGHSSGSFVAHELLGQLAGGSDPNDVTAGKVVYFDLDGGESGLSSSIVARLRRAYFVGSYDGANGTSSPNASDMRSAAATFGSGGYFQNDASASGCAAGAVWCVHVTLITTRPHNPNDASAIADYSDFVNRPVAHAWLDAKSIEAGL